MLIHNIFYQKSSRMNLQKNFFFKLKFNHYQIYFLYRRKTKNVKLKMNQVTDANFHQKKKFIPTFKIKIDQKGFYSSR